MPIESVVLLIVAVLNALMAYIIATRNAKSNLHRVFAVTITFNIFWTIGDALMLGSSDQTIVELGIKLFLIAPIFTAWMLAVFAIRFVDMSANKLVHISMGTVAILLTAYILLYEPMFTSFQINEGEMNSFEVEKLNYSIYAFFFSAYFISSYTILFLGYLRSRGIKKAQCLNILWAAIASSGAASVTNLMLPLYGNTSLVWLGPIFTMSYIAIVSYSIAKNKLFDIRSVVARSISYTFTVVVLATIAQGLTLLVFNQGVDGTSSRDIVNGVLFFAAGIMFMMFRPKFDEITGRLFYRDDFVSEKELDRLSNIVVSEYNIDDLMEKASAVIVDALKPAFLKIILVDEDGNYYAEYSYGKDEGISPTDAISVVGKQESQLFNVEEISAYSTNAPVSEGARTLLDYYEKSDVSLALKLDAKTEVVGFVLIGPKLSGLRYRNKDTNYVGIAANELSIAIQNARRFDEIKRFNETLSLEVDRATKELRESNEKLQELDKAKDEFVSMASHQLRTPLTSVKGYLSMVLDGDVGKISKKQHEMLGAAFTSSQRMVYLIADLLNVSRLQTGKFVIEPQVSYLPTVVKGEIEQLKETANAKNLKITYKEPKNFPELYLDETKLRQVIMNFLDNSIYYTPPNGKINIELMADENKVEFRVIDNGIGVPRHEQKNMFTKFYRAANAKKARPDGTGLGLFMAKKVVVDQGGAIIFESKEDEGSTFGFTFPLSRVRLPKDKAQKPNAKKSSAKAKKSNQK